MSDVEAQKRAVGEAAAALVEAGMVVGLGTGSTAVWFVKALGARGLEVTCVATSLATADLAASLGLKVAELGETREIDLTVDGADEIGPGLGLIKGAGGALLREKLVWEASRRCVVIADASSACRCWAASRFRSRWWRSGTGPPRCGSATRSPSATSAQRPGFG